MKPDRIDDAAEAFNREICRAFRIPEALVGLHVPWWQRIVQRITRRP